MKKILLTLLIIFSFDLCSYGENHRETSFGMNKKPKTRPVQPTVDGNPEVLDMDFFNEHVIEGEKHIDVQLEDGTQVYIYPFYNGGGEYVKYFPDSYWTVRKEYHTNNSIREKGLMFGFSGFKKGIWYYFDEQGELTDVVDHDEPFKFTFDDVFRFCKLERIPLVKGYDYGDEQGAVIRRYVSEDDCEDYSNCFWEIGFATSLGAYGLVHIIKLDGTTGKEISREEFIPLPI